MIRAGANLLRLRAAGSTVGLVPKVSYRAALAVPEFRALFAAAATAITAQVVSSVVLTVLVFDRTRSPLLSAATFTLGFLPFLVTGTVLSGVVDRVPPRRLLASCTLGSAGLTAVMALPGTPVAGMFALLVGTGTLSGFGNAAQAALVRSVVPEAAYVPARSLVRIAVQGAQLGGNPIGGLLFITLSASGSFLASAALLAVAAVLARFGIRSHPATGPADGTALLRDSLRGVRNVFAQARLRRLMLLGWLVPTFSVAPEALAAPYIAGRGASPALVGWWLAALPIGIITGDLIGVTFLSARRQRLLVGAAAAASFVPYLVFAATPPIAVALPLLAVSGTCSMYSLGLDGMVRQAAPEHLFARAMAVNSAGLLTLQALGFAFAGALGAVVGPGAAIAIAGVCGIVAVACLHPRAIAAAAATVS
jgi:MFS family permease